MRSKKQKAAVQMDVKETPYAAVEEILEKKLELLKLHASQVDKTRVENLTILESVRSCANFRGYQGRVKFAEGFKALRVLRHI